MVVVKQFHLLFNFKKHLNMVNKTIKLVGKEVEEPDRKRQRSGMDTDNSKPKRRCTLTRNSIPAQNIKEDLSTVESPAFNTNIEVA